MYLLNKILHNSTNVQSCFSKIQYCAKVHKSKTHSFLKLICECLYLITVNTLFYPPNFIDLCKYLLFLNAEYGQKTCLKHSSGKRVNW